MIICILEFYNSNTLDTVVCKTLKAATTSQIAQHRKQDNTVTKQASRYLACQPVGIYTQHCFRLGNYTQTIV